MADHMNFCISCTHRISHDARRPNGLVHLSLCDKAPRKVEDVNYYVTGVEGDKFHFCSTARGTDSLCGHEGKWFEPVAANEAA